MKHSVLIVVVGLLTLASCNKDEDRTCSTCSSDLTSNFEVCREADGTASVNGENTDTDYDTYISGLQQTGVSCGGE